MKIIIQKIANGYLLVPQQGETLHCENLDVLSVRLKVTFGEMQASEFTHALKNLKTA